MDRLTSNRSFAGAGGGEVRRGDERNDEAADEVAGEMRVEAQHRNLRSNDTISPGCLAWSDTDQKIDHHR